MLKKTQKCNRSGKINNNNNRGKKERGIVLKCQ